MKQETKVTQKYQTTIPKEIRKYLGVNQGECIRWHIVKGMVVVDSHKKIPHPIKFLISQIKLNVDAVKLVKESREDFR